jgi:pimeloyl-ACP methyl ester carboxylesterase
MVLLKIESGININYVLEGPENAPVLVFMHGYCGCHEGMKMFQDRYKDRYQVLIYDARGHGDSDKPKGKTDAENLALYSMERLARDLDELLAALKLPKNPKEKVIVGGHSMGGMEAFAYYFQFPAKVKALIPMSTTLGYNQSSIAAMNTLVNEFPPFSCWHYNYHDRMGEIKVPVLAIHGKKDNMQPWQNAIEMQEKMPDCKAVIIKKGSHMITDENQPEMFGAIDEFLVRMNQ